MSNKQEITQETFLVAQALAKQEGKTVLLIDTVLKPIEGISTQVYNPIQLKALKKRALLVFYCDTGKASLERIQEYAKKLPMHMCYSLYGGRGYWRKNLRANAVTNKSVIDEAKTLVAKLEA